MSISKIKEKSLTSDAVTESNLDTTAFTGQTELSETANDSDILLIYDASSGSLKKILKSNVALQSPQVSSVSPTNIVTGDGTGNATFTITGSRFDATANAALVSSTGSEISFDTVTRDSATQITAVIAISSLTNAGEPYDVRVTNGNGLVNTLTDQITINAQPVYTTSAGSLGSVIVGNAGSFSVNATDPESAGDVTFELQSGSLPPGYTLTNTSAEGGTAIISGTDNTTSSGTTYNFTLRAVDAASNTSSRSFSIFSRPVASESFTSSGTFSVPTGVTQTDVLVVAGGGGAGFGYGGGGGAGGLIFVPNYPVTPNGTVTITVGCGGPGTPDGGGTSGQDSVFGSPGDPGFSPTSSVLTAKGGGGGGGGNAAVASQPGGSGGGGGGASPGSTQPGGSATQPTQPGSSGTFGFGNAGGQGVNVAAGGGGGAGAAGSNGVPGSNGGDGGDGKAYTIADGTTPVYYAGGGAGGPANACGGLGGGGPASPCGSPVTNAQANTGGGGGGPGPQPSGNGGKGIVIVRY